MSEAMTLAATAQNALSHFLRFVAHPNAVRIDGWLSWTWQNELKVSFIQLNQFRTPSAA